MEAPSLFRRFWPVMALLAFPLVAQSGASLSQTRFAAKGRKEAILVVTKAGRYTLLASSQQGARVQIVDRMIGPAEADGTAGERDGRLDLLLDAGRYKVLVDSADKGQGEVALEVKACTELHAPEPPVLAELKPVREPLDDFQQRSWWIHIPERRIIYVEAQGRNLADLRIWREGAWLMDAAPQVREAEPVNGRPERLCMLSADLNPGYYLLTAYGGAPRVWAKETSEHPFSLRFGIPTLPVTSRVSAVLPATGVERYLVPKGANTYILQLAQKHAIRLELSGFAPGDVPGVPEASAAIDKKSADPECKVRHAASKPYALMTIVGTPGEPYILQSFDEEDSYTFSSRVPQDYRITTLHSGYVDDVIDATGILVSSASGNPHTSAAAEDVLHLGGEKGWTRRFNLLGENTVFFFVEQAGDYQIRSSGTGARFRFEPFMLTRPADYRTPDFQESGSVFDLDKGYWVLTIQPKTKGILKVALQQKGYLDRLKDWLLGADQTPPAPTKGSSTFPKVTLDPRYSYTLYLNHQDGVDRGAVIQPLPLTFEEPIPLALQPGKEESLAVTAKSESRMKIFTLANAPFACFVDGKPWSEAMPITAGTHYAWFRNDSPKTLLLTLQGVPPAQLEGAPPQFLGAGDKQTLNHHLPVLAEQTPLFMDLGAQEQRTALLSVATPGLYRIETTGLLKTSLNLRSAVRTKLFSAEANGTGRNALLSQYLKEGTYLLTTQTLDASAGHAGLRVKRTEVTAGGELVLSQETKADVPANQGILYTFKVAEAGRYAIQTLGQSRFFPCRLEDGEGWPILAPATPSNLVQRLEPGSYRFMDLPLDVDTQRLTTVARIADQRKVEGKGPHTIALNEKIENRWREGSPRVRDTYRLTMPADLDVEVKLGNDQMQAFLRKVGSNAPPLPVPPGKSWSGSLEAGNYLVEVECSRINDLVDYSLMVTTGQLAPGLAHEVSVPGTVEVRLAKEAVVELFSHGQVDVRASLMQNGELVDANDDSFNDWNFRIARRLPAGHYLLQVEPVGGKTGKTTVGMAAPPEAAKEPLSEGEHTLDLGGAITVLPLHLKEGAEILSVRISGASQFGCILERDGAVPLVTRTGQDITFDIPLRKGSAYRLRLWSADHQSETVHLRTVSGSANTAPFARIQLAEGGTFAPEPATSFSCSSSPDQAMESATNGLTALPAGETMIHWAGKNAGRLSRVFLGEQTALRLRVPRGVRQELDVKGQGPTVVLSHALRGRTACLALPASGERPYHATAYGVRGDDAVTVIPPSAPGRVLLWDPQEDAPQVSEMEVCSRSFRALPAPEVVAFGARQGAISPNTVRQWTLPAGSKHVEIVLEDGLAAYLSEGDQVAGVAFAKGEATRTPFNTAASRLVVMNISGREAAYEFNVLEQTGDPLPKTLSTDSPFEHVFPQAGILRFTVAPAAGERVLSLAGTCVSGEWMDDAGTVHTGQRFELRSGGVALITHGPGLVKAWISAKGQETEARWASPERNTSLPLKPNTLAALSGPIRDYAFTVVQPSAFHLLVACPAVVRLSGEGNVDRVSEGQPQTVLDDYLTPGTYRLRIRALQGEILRGTAEFSLAEVLPITKTLGPERLIHDDETQLFMFTARAKGRYGIGLKTDREVLNAQLLRPDGMDLGTGSQQFAELEPGTYLLRISLPPGQEPVKYAPVVVGLEAPGNGPPEDVLNGFLNSIGLNQ